MQVTMITPVVIQLRDLIEMVFIAFLIGAVVGGSLMIRVGRIFSGYRRQRDFD